MPQQYQTTYSYSQLRKLWIDAGGNKGWSYVMAAIAMAESGGNPHAHHVDANGSVDYGLWQINTVHHYSVADMLNPQMNAKEAVSIFNSSGPHAWSTYNNGAYKKYMPGNKSAPNIADPVPGASFARIDQGVDYVAKGPVHALVSGRITDIVPFATGEGVASHTAILEKFDAPVTIGDRTYYGGYYSEEKPLVKKGQHVQAGENVMAGGSDEIGFLINKGTTFPPLVGGLGAGTQPTKPGRDYAAVVAKTGGPNPGGSTIGSALGDALSVGGDVASVVTDPIGAAIGLAGDAASAVGNSMFGGIKSLVYQMLFGLIGTMLILIGLGIIAYTLMGKTGISAPGVVGVIQQQQRIGQASRRIDESQRASMVRESQASQRIAGQGEQRQLSSRRLDLQEKQAERRDKDPAGIIYPVQERVVRNRGKYR